MDSLASHLKAMMYWCYVRVVQDIHCADASIGGIGVTPMLSIFRHCFHKIKTRQWDIKKIYLFWALRDPSLYYMLGGIITLMSCHFDRYVEWCLKEWCKWLLCSCCLDYSAWRWISDVCKRKTWLARLYFGVDIVICLEIFRTIRDTHTDVSRIGVLSCGPEALVNSVWDCSNKLSTKETAFDFHQETFDFWAFCAFLYVFFIVKYDE